MHFSHVHLAYKERTILRDIDLDIVPWEFLFLIWASGWGKTSLIKSMIGAMKPRSGHIYDKNKKDIYKKNTDDLLSYRRSIGVIFQDFKLLPKKTVWENVSFAMEVCGYDKIAIEKRTPEVLSQVWLLQKRHTFIESLSGWELQRTAIARALIHNPDIIIGDEPTGNLDPKNAEEILALLLHLNTLWKTIIIATHDDRMVNTINRRVLAFADGKIVSDTNPGRYLLI